jgi:hypothetical protein
MNKTPATNFTPTRTRRLTTHVQVDNRIIVAVVVVRIGKMQRNLNALDTENSNILLAIRSVGYPTKARQSETRCLKWRSPHGAYKQNETTGSKSSDKTHGSLNSLYFAARTIHRMFFQHRYGIVCFVSFHFAKKSSNAVLFTEKRTTGRNEISDSNRSNHISHTYRTLR